MKHQIIKVIIEIYNQGFWILYITCGDCILVIEVECAEIVRLETQFFYDVWCKKIHFNKKVKIQKLCIKSREEEFIEYYKGINITNG